MLVTVYILLCSDGSYYVGLTKKPLEARVWEHNEGLDPGSYTHSRRPVAVVFAQQFTSVVQAIALERQLKGWSRRKKEALIAGNLAALPDLASRPKRR